MTPEELQALKNEVDELKYRLDRLDRADRFIFWKPLTSEGAGIRLGLTGEKVALFGKPPIAQPSSHGETLGHTANGGTTVGYTDTFYGGTSPAGTAYTLNDIVKHLKELGILAA